MPTNPAHSVRGPKLSRETGTTPVLSAKQARALPDQPDPSTLSGARDRAIISLMLYSFARVSAVVGLKISNYFPGAESRMIRLAEKGGKQADMPVHHEAEAFIDHWLEVSGLAEVRASPLFPILT